LVYLKLQFLVLHAVGRLGRPAEPPVHAAEHAAAPDYWGAECGDSHCAAGSATKPGGRYDDGVCWSDICYPPSCTSLRFSNHTHLYSPGCAGTIQNPCCISSTQGRLHRLGIVIRFCEAFWPSATMGLIGDKHQIVALATCLTVYESLPCLKE
jgi:hypothetical protein